MGVVDRCHEILYYMHIRSLCKYIHSHLSHVSCALYVWTLMNIIYQVCSEYVRSPPVSGTPNISRTRQRKQAEQIVLCIWINVK